LNANSESLLDEVTELILPSLADQLMA